MLSAAVGATGRKFRSFETLNMQAAREIERAVDEIAGNWIMAEADQSRSLLKHYENEIENFKNWACAYGLKLPVGGRVGAGYLLELGADGATLFDLIRAARGIALYYETILGAYLDLR